MKQAHTFNLKVEFDNGHKWDLDILAVDSTWLTSWWDGYCRDHNCMAIKIEINLIKRNAETVKDNFGARSIQSNILIQS